MKSYQDLQVSILVLMDLCIKTVNGNCQLCIFIKSFNPCFNGSMYKNSFGMVGQEILDQFQSLF